MSGRRSRMDASTGDLFSGIPSPLPLREGSMDFRKPVALLISDMIKASGESRWAIAARMSELADVETSKAVLDSYTAESRDACNLPMWKAPLLELATNSRRLAEWHAESLGGRVLWGSDVLDADVGRMKREMAQLQDQLRKTEQLQRLVKGRSR